MEFLFSIISSIWGDVKLTLNSRRQILLLILREFKIINFYFHATSLQIFIIFLDSTKLKIVWIKIVWNCFNFIQEIAKVCRHWSSFLTGEKFIGMFLRLKVSSPPKNLPFSAYEKFLTKIVWTKICLDKNCLDKIA